MRSKKTEALRLRLLSALIVSLLPLATGACGGEDLLLPSSGQPARIIILRGDGQTGTVAQPLSDSLVVQVTDPEDRPVSGVEVAFSAPAGAALMPNDTVVTGQDGRAAVWYIMAPASGDQTVEVRAEPVVPSANLTTTFRASALSEAAVQLVAAGGDRQEGEVQTPLAESLVVKAVDRFGNGVAGVQVSWVVSDGAVNPEIVATGVDGRAATERTLGARPGLYLASAEAAGLEGSPVTFETIGVAPPSPQLLLVIQPSASAAAGVPLERQPVLQLHDAAGTPLARADVAVAAQITDGGGSLGGTTTARSNAEGRVAFTDLSVRGSPGTRTLVFATGDFTPATSEPIDVRAGPPAPGRSSASVPNGTAGTPTRIPVRLEDEFGTSVSGAAEAITVRVEGANPAGVSVAEQRDGGYLAVYTPTTAGTDRVIVEVNGISVAGSPFASLVEPGPADPSTTITRVIRSGIFRINVTVTTLDAHGNILGRGGDRVQLRLNDGDFVDAVDNGNGIYFGSFFPVLSFSIVVTLNGVPVAGSPFSTETS